MQAWDQTKDTVNKALDDKVPRLSAALSYYSIFSLAPLLLIAISIAGAVFGEEAASGLLAIQLRSAIGTNAAEAVQEMVMRTRKPADNIVASLTGVAVLLIGAGGVFGQLQDALNTVWGVSPRPGRVLRTLIRERFLSFSMVLGTGFMLLTSLILTTVLQATMDTMSSIIHVPPAIWTLLSSALAFVIVTGLFAAIFKLLPDAHVEWQDVRFGAVLTAGLFVAGKFLLGWYLGREATTSVYGSAGSLVLILLWVYYTSLILLLGAEFTQVHARARGRDIRPTSRAVRVSRTTLTLPEEQQQGTLTGTPSCP